MNPQLLAVVKLGRLPPLQGFDHIPSGGGQAVGEGDGVGRCLGCTRRRVGPGDECRIPGQAYLPERHLRHGDVVDGLHERFEQIREKFSTRYWWSGSRWPLDTDKSIMPDCRLLAFRPSARMVAAPAAVVAVAEK